MSLNLEDYDDDDLLHAALSWADRQDDFDPEFLESLAEANEKHGALTERQRSSLCNIIEKFKIPL